jgi:hypothetical protein
MEADEGHSINDPDFWYVGKLLWIGPELFAITKLGEVKLGDDMKIMPIDVEKVEW